MIIKLIFFSLLFLNGILIFANAKRGILANPAIFNVLYWFVNIIVAILLFREVSWAYSGLIFILIFVDVFYFSFYIGNHFRLKTINRACFKQLLEKHVIIFIAMIAGVLYVVELISNNGFSIRDFMSLESFMNMGHYFVDGKYGDTVIIYSTIGQIALSLCYAGALFCGYKYRQCRGNIIIYTIYIPIVIMTVVTTHKAYMIVSVLLFFSGILTYSMVFDQLKLTKQLLRKSIIAICGIIIIISASFYVRYGIGTSATVIINKFIMYGLGHVPCFDIGFSKFDKTLMGDSFGYFTFQGIYELIFSKPDTSKFKVYTLITKYDDTNVRTIFGDMLMDFGILGSIIVSACFGLVGGMVFTTAQKEKIVDIAIIALINFMICYSFLISPLRYMTIIMAMIFFLGMLMFDKKEKKIRD